jgi:hypothetical protein
MVDFLAGLCSDYADWELFVSESAIDLCFEIAMIFHKMAVANRDGWHTATISYKMDCGNLILIDEVKVVFSGETNLKGIPLLSPSTPPDKP